VVINLERGADLHMAQLKPLPRTISCFSKIQIGFTFLVPAHPSSPGKRAVKWVMYVCVYLLLFSRYSWLSKVADFNPPHLHLAPPQGVTTVEFLGNGFRKLESLGYCVVLFV